MKGAQLREYAHSVAAAYLLAFVVVMVATALFMQTSVYAQLVDVQPVTLTQCTEDMECWDCETMGNRVCGPNINKGSK